MPDLKSVLAWSAVAAGVAIAAERRVSRLLQDPDAPVLDWDLVRRTAYSRSGSSGAAEAAEVGGAYDPLVRELVPLLADACGTGGQTNFGEVRVVDRRGFIDQNLGMMRRLLRPVEQGAAGFANMRPNPLMRVPASIYVGTLLGFMARRVLGQYDPVLSFLPEAASGAEAGEELPAPALLIIEPNVREFERRSELDRTSLRKWLMLHELTHAWQFETHPWLAPYLGSLIRELTKVPSPAVGAKALEEMIRAASRLPGQLATVGKMQAVMAVLEGQGNYVMREVGRRYFADYDSLDAAFHRRHDEPQAAEKLLMWISGVALKLQQYRQGERFLRRVQAVAGQPGLDRIWTGPQAMPGWSEIRRPDLWLRRMGYLGQQRAATGGAEAATA